MYCSFAGAETLLGFQGRFFIAYTPASCVDMSLMFRIYNYCYGWGTRHEDGRTVWDNHPNSDDTDIDLDSSELLDDEEDSL